VPDIKFCIAACALGFSGLIQAQALDITQLKEGAYEDLYTFVIADDFPGKMKYGELSPKEMEYFRSKFVNIQPGDVPPFPVGGMQTLMDPIRKISKDKNLQGDLQLSIRVGSDGEVTKVNIIETPNREFAKYAARVAFQTKFEPAICEGQICESSFPLIFQLATCATKKIPKVSGSAFESKIEGTVVVQLQVIKGVVHDVNVLSGPREFYRSVLASAKTMSCDQGATFTANRSYRFTLE
jgi:hypothetical protein